MRTKFYIFMRDLYFLCPNSDGWANSKWIAFWSRRILNVGKWARARKRARLNCQRLEERNLNRVRYQEHCNHLEDM
jgi:hypothetical protein